MARRRPDPRKRAQILRAATDAFSTREFHAVPVEAVAGAAGVGKGTLYLYFPTKEQLFYATILEALDELHAELAAATATRHGEDAVHAFVASFLEFFWRRRHLAVLMHRYEHKLREPAGADWRERRARIVALARAIIEPRARQRALAGSELTLATEMLLALLRAVILNHQEGDRPEDAAALIVDLFLHGLAPGPAREVTRSLRRVRGAEGRA